MSPSSRARYCAACLLVAVLLGFGVESVASSIAVAGPAGSVSFGEFVAALPNGNFVVSDPEFDSNRGAVYLYTKTGQLISTLTGTSPGDLIGATDYDEGIFVLANGNFLVFSTYWSNGGIAHVGAVTFGDANTGVSGTVSITNSLVGTVANERIGNCTRLRALANGNYVISYGFWNGGRGAVVWGNGTSGTTGVISANNALIGTNPTDSVGLFVSALPNGNYVVTSPRWNGNTGASTFGDGAHGTVGPVSTANSLTGASGVQDPNNESVMPLGNGSYVLLSPNWNNGSGATTLIDGTTGLVGAISADNSLVGEPNQAATTTVGSHVGGAGVIELSNGNYVVLSTSWNQSRGAATWGDGHAGVKGHVSALNSLVGTSPDDRVGFYVLALVDGDYVVLSPNMHATGASGDIADVGAATWGNGTQGIVGLVSAANSLIGDSSGDQVGSGTSLTLANGNYVIGSPQWHGALGAATWMSASGSHVGIVSSDNSFTGTTPGLGNVGFGMQQLATGNYVIPSRLQNQGTTTWADGSVGITGIVSGENSMVDAGSTQLSFAPVVRSLPNGNYLVSSSGWNNGLGAVTWLSGSQSNVGVVSNANSLVGDGTYKPGDAASVLNNTYLILQANDSPTRATTLVRANQPAPKTIDASNSVIGSASSTYYQPASDLLVVGQAAQNRVIVFQLDSLFSEAFE